MASFSIILFVQSREYRLEYKYFFLKHHPFTGGIMKQILLPKQILSKLIVITQEIFKRDLLMGDPI